MLQQETTQIPIVLGPFGAAVVGVLFASLQLATGYIAYRATKRARTAEAWQSTALANASAAAAAKSEKDVYKEKVERQEREAMQLVEENARLKAATDLSLFSAANQEEHLAIMATMKAMAADGERRYEQAMHAISENTRVLLAFQSHMAGVFETQGDSFRRISEALEKILERA